MIGELTTFYLFLLMVKARRTSYAFKRQQEEAESWVELQVHGFDSGASLDEYDRMFCTTTEKKVIIT